MLETSLPLEHKLKPLFVDDVGLLAGGPVQYWV